MHSYPSRTREVQPDAESDATVLPVVREGHRYERWGDLQDGVMVFARAY